MDRFLAAFGTDLGFCLAFGLGLALALGTDFLFDVALATDFLGAFAFFTFDEADDGLCRLLRVLAIPLYTCQEYNPDTDYWFEFTTTTIKLPNRIRIMVHSYIVATVLRK